MTMAQRAKIEKHGRQLLVIYRHARERDPVKLYKALRRLEGKAAAIALRLCNGPEFPNEETVDELFKGILLCVHAVLGPIGPRVFINRDPRGYQLKIREEEAKDLNITKDWGGYGLIAPEIGRDGWN